MPEPRCCILGEAAVQVICHRLGQAGSRCPHLWWSPSKTLVVSQPGTLECGQASHFHPGGGSPIWVTYSSKASSKPLNPAFPDPAPLPQLGLRLWGQLHSARPGFLWLLLCDRPAPGHSRPALGPRNTQYRGCRYGPKSCTVNAKCP